MAPSAPSRGIRKIQNTLCTQSYSIASSKNSNLISITFYCTYDVAIDDSKNSTLTNISFYCTDDVAVKAGECAITLVNASNQNRDYSE
jgi:hypothetical protein